MLMQMVSERNTYMNCGRCAKRTRGGEFLSYFIQLEIT